VAFARLLALACLLACVVCSSLSSAQTSASDEPFQKGRDAAKRGDYATACAFFSESYALDASAGTLFNLAHCQEQLRRVATAWTQYQELVKRLNTDDPRLPLIQERIRALEPRLSRVTLALAESTPRDVDVSLDGKKVEPDALGAPIVIDPGDHVVEVAALDRVTKRYTFIIAESETKTLELAAGEMRPPESPKKVEPAPRPAPVRAPPPTAEPEQDLDWQRISGWTLVGLGGAGLLTSGVAALMVLDHKATVKDECDDVGDGTLKCSPDGKQAADDGKVWGTVGTVAFILGAASLGAGSYLVLTADPGSEAMVTLHARF
jgi:hypothetical protein